MANQEQRRLAVDRPQAIQFGFLAALEREFAIYSGIVHQAVNASMPLNGGGNPLHQRVPVLGIEAMMTAAGILGAKRHLQGLRPPRTEAERIAGFEQACRDGSTNSAVRAGNKDYAAFRVQHALLPIMNGHPDAGPRPQYIELDRYCNFRTR